jgi:protein-S-isoprenylcysteine O-methyltransferase Ste14
VTLTVFAVQIPDALRLAMLAGLLAHKGLWEILKRRGGSLRPAAPHVSRSVRLVKLGKMALLALLLAQTLCLEILPIVRQPGVLRLVGAAIFLIGLATAMSARIQLGRNWADLEDADVARGQSIVERGIYRYVRHPIYAGDLALLVGLELGLNSWLVLGVPLLAAVVVHRTLAEEALLAEQFPGYRTYCARTKRFIPFVV